MGVTNYYTANGRLFSEKASGAPASTRIDYLTDALGSVIGTLDQTATVQNTYRYKPYGSLLTKTGVASDPAFTWVGSFGYRQTGNAIAEMYVRARHYSSTLASWLSRDPKRSGRNWYSYADESPVTFYDPSGLQRADKGGILPPSCNPDYYWFAKDYCNCGPDVTDKTAEQIKKIQSDFKGWNQKEKVFRCAALIDKRIRSTAWDIVPLNRYVNTEVPTCSRDMQHCNYSVTVGNRCHCAGFVNYVAYGTMFRECFDEGVRFWTNYGSLFFFDQRTMEFVITAWKLWAYNDPVGANTAVSWATTGWFHAFPGVNASSKTDCQPCNDKDTQTFKYVWLTQSGPPWDFGA